MSHTKGIELCIVFARVPEFHYLATIRSPEDARMLVQQRVAALRSLVELDGKERPAINRWLAAEAVTVVIPNEKLLLLPEGWVE